MGQLEKKLREGIMSDWGKLFRREEETNREPEKKYFIPRDRVEELYWIIDELADKPLTQRYRLLQFIKGVFPSIKGSSISVNVDNIEKPYVLAEG